MATRLKTVRYAFATLASLTNNTLTNLTQRTIYLPETGTKTFRSAILTISCDDIVTATGGTITTKTLNFRLGAAGYTSVANANALTNSGENLSVRWSQDYTGHFTTNWTGTSMTCDVQIQLNQSTGTTLGMVNVCATLDITYEYDDTSTTQVKTVMIPLNAPVATVTTSAVTYDTFPNLDTYLPEASKTYRGIYLVVQGNEQANATTDNTMTINLGSTTVTTGNYEHALQTDRFIRYVFEVQAAGFTGTNATQNFQLSSTVARLNHVQCYAVVTYEYNESTSTSIMNSVMLPMEMDSPMGGTTSSDYQRATRELMIQEPTTIATSRIAFFPFWTEIAAIGGLNMRIGTGSFVTYTDGGAQYAGACAAMIRDDSAFTLARGRNEFNFDIYRTDTADFGWNISGFWLVNYTSGKSSSGSGAHNHTVLWNLQQCGTAAVANIWTIAATAPVIPETSYYMTAIGTESMIYAQNNIVPAGINISVERLSAEGGIKWESAYRDIVQTDVEAGTYYVYSQIRDLFDRWPNDLYAVRMNVETSRRWRINLPPALATTAVGWATLNLIFTYHSITFTVSGTVSNSSGGTVMLYLARNDQGDVPLETSRVGNGTYSFTWYDNTETVYVMAVESATLIGMSASDYAA